METVSVISEEKKKHQNNDHNIHSQIQKSDLSF